MQNELEPEGLPEARVVASHYFAQVPEWVIYHPSLSDAAVRCYAVLVRLANSDGLLWRGQIDIAQRMGRSDRAIRGYLSELQEVGAVSRVRRRMNATAIWNVSLVDRQNRSGMDWKKDSAPNRNESSDLRTGKKIPLKESPSESDNSNSHFSSLPTAAENTDAVARRIAKKDWDRRKAANESLPVEGKFMGYYSRIRAQLIAGHTEAELNEVLPTMDMFSANAFDFVWSRRKNGGRGTPPRDTAIEGWSEEDRTGPVRIEQIFL